MKRIASLALLAFAAACGGRHEVPATEVHAVRAERLPEDPADPAWNGAPAYRAALILQDLVEPRLLVPSTPNVSVRALTDGQRIAFLLVWDDPTADDTPGAARFPDACAIQLPQVTEADVPDPQMGQAGRTVEITVWKASWQAWVDGRPNDIRALYPNAAISHYPFEAASLAEGSVAQHEMELRYAPARRLGQAPEGPRDKPVEDLLAEGPGTITHDPEQQSQGRGSRTPAGWQVVIVRPLPANLGPGNRSQIAFAVWNGAKEEVGARKMRSAWVPLAVGTGA